MRGVPISPDSKRVLATVLFEMVHRRIPERERLGVLTGLREDTVSEALTELARVGAVVTDGGGRLVAAYPLSAVPTTHTVEFESSAPWANCAIDALAVPMMVEHATVWQRPKSWQGRVVPVHEALLLAAEWFGPIIELYSRHQPSA